MSRSNDISSSKTDDVNMETRHFYLQQAGLPDNFSMDKLHRTLDALFPILDEADHISQYVRLLERIGVLSYEDGSAALTLIRPVDLLVKWHIEDRLSASKAIVDENILNEIVSASGSDSVHPKIAHQNRSKLVLLIDK